MGINALSISMAVHMACPAGQILGHGSDSWPDLQHHVLLRHSCCQDDLIQNVGVNKEILAEFLLEGEFVFLYDLNRMLWVAQCWHGGFSCLVIVRGAYPVKGQAFTGGNARNTPDYENPGNLDLL